MWAYCELVDAVSDVKRAVLKRNESVPAEGLSGYTWNVLVL
jgi:hypothetical protein